MWLSNFSGPQPTWIQFEFDRVYKLREMWVWNQNQQIENAIGYVFKDVSVEYSADGISFTPLGAGTEFARAPGAPGYAHNTTVDFGGVTAKYVRLTPNSNWGGFVPQYGLSEVRFLYIPVVARDPKPGSGTQDVSVEATLSWRAGREAARHNVYLSTDQQAVIDGTAPVTAVTVPSYVSSLDLASTYYWRVDEVNDIETPTTWQGNVWSLSTQEYLVVDDFESYNEIAVGQPGSNLVYTTWLDGYGTTTNGSTMGYPTGNSLETTTVHGGTKAVPLIYNNSTASFSEVERTFAPQNWTSHGIQTLSVWFRGDATNVPGQLYVKINGIKSLYDGDAANLKREAWQTWNIDLASVGAPLQNVTRLAIGIDTKGATGTLLLDDIRLYPNTRELITPVQPNAAGLIGHWRFDGNTQDASGLGNHGTAGGGTTFGAGIVGSGAINLSGSGYVVIDGVANDITSTNITLAAWIKTTQTTEGNVFSCNDSATGHPLILGVTNGNLWFEDNASTQFAAVNDDQWHLIAYVRNGATGYIYLDGIQIGTEPANFSFGSVTRWSIGQEWDNSTPSDFYTGLVDDARIYNYPLSEAEIAGLAGMTLPFDKPF